MTAVRTMSGALMPSTSKCQRTPRSGIQARSTTGRDTVATTALAPPTTAAARATTRAEEGVRARPPVTSHSPTAPGTSSMRISAM